jgi:hypothetical protein
MQPQRLELSIVNQLRQLNREECVATTVACKVKGRKRHLLVDTEGLVLKVKVEAANLSDREGAKLLLAGLKETFPRSRALVG